MRWIDTQDLVRWIDDSNARKLLPEMVSGLILASIGDPNKFRFPARAASEVRGFDGDLESDKETLFVPKDKSKWEFGAGGGGISKANSDYAKRTNETDPAVMADNTLVVVSLVPWNTVDPKLPEWEQARTAERKWKSVRYIDGVQLTHWLDLHPAVAARFARDVLRTVPQQGAISTDEFWLEYSRQFKVPLHESVVIAGRIEKARDLLGELQGASRPIVLGADSSEEALAFAVAAIRTADENTRRALEARTLIVRTPEAAHQLSNRTGLVFLVDNGAELQAGMLAAIAPTLSFVSGLRIRDPRQKLPSPTAASMAEGFELMGMEREVGYELAQRCGRSLTILKRLFPSATARLPEWVPLIGNLKPAFFAGSWHSDKGKDCEILTELSGLADYDALDGVLRPTLALSDPPLSTIAGLWQVRSPVEAFSLMAGQITGIDLQRLQGAAIKVFSHKVTQPGENEVFRNDFVAEDDYSRWLRDGLALTLLIVASLHESAGLHVKGKTPQQYVDEIVTALPEWGRSHESLMRLGDQAALFAEAAPNPFLVALESILEGEPNDFAKLLTTDDVVFSLHSPYVNIIWCLEVLAWSPHHLNSAARLLAKMASLDHQQSFDSGNNPMNSLRAILLSWQPATYATSAQRLACLDVILKTHPQVGWNLLVRLFPTSHDMAWPTQRPRVRDMSPMATEVLTFGVVWKFQQETLSRALAIAGDDEDKNIVLVHAFSGFRQDSRQIAIAHIATYLERHRSAEGCRLWFELNDEVSKHEFFAGAEWVMDEPERKQLRDLLEQHAPSDPMAAERQFFDDWVPTIGRYEPGRELVNAETLRKDSLDQILNREGADGVIRLARLVKQPSLVGETLERTSITITQLTSLLEASLHTEVPGSLPFYASATGVKRFGTAWIDIVMRIAHTIPEPSSKAKLFIGWPQGRETWTIVERFGADVSDEYWNTVNSLPSEGPPADLIAAIEKLMAHGRGIDVLGMVFKRLAEIPSTLLITLLDQCVANLDNDFLRLGDILAFRVNCVLTELRNRTDVSKDDLAQKEFEFISLTASLEPPESMHHMLASNPSLFVETLSRVYRPKSNVDERAATDADIARSRVARRLLNSFDVVPGLNDNVIESVVLNEWIDSVRSAAAAVDRADVADYQIGRLLSYAPTNPARPNMWPQTAVCEVVERLASDALDEGFSVECMNQFASSIRAFGDGGDRERELAEIYEERAKATIQYARVSALLESVAKAWIARAKQEDDQAEQRKMWR